MSDKKFSVLGILAVGAIVLAVAVSQYANRVKPVASGSGFLVQGLDSETVAKIIVKRDEDSVTLKRGQNGFVIVEKADYPAPVKMINNLFASCMDIKMVEFYTENTANYKDLGVTEEEPAGGMIKFFDANDKLITGVIIGKDTESGKGNLTYGKLINDNKVYVMTDIPYIQATAIDYANRDLVYVKRDEIASVTVSSPNDNYTLVSEANGMEVTLKETPAGKQQKKEVCRQVLGALSSLRFDDVMPDSQPAGLVFDSKYSCLLKDSTLINIGIAKKDSKCYIKLNVDFTDKEQVRKEEGVESQAELKKKEAKLLAREKAKKLSDTVNGWIYEIPSYCADNMTKPMKDLVEDIPSPKANEANDVNAPQAKAK